MALALIATMTAATSSAAQGASCEGPPSNTTINVIIDGLRNAKGQMAVTLYPDDSRRFLAHHGSLYVGRVRSTAPTTRMCLYVPKPGIYVIAVYHDENGDGKIDRGGLLGIPTEGFGFSNNPPTLVSLPSYRSVRLNIPRTGLSTRITLTYP